MKHRLHILGVQQFIQALQLGNEQMFHSISVGNSNKIKIFPLDFFDASCQVYVYSEETGGVEIQEREVIRHLILQPNP